MRPVSALLLAATLLGGLSSCHKDDPTPTPTASLYSRLGGLPAVSAVVDQFLSNVIAETMNSDSKLKRTFTPLIQSGDPYRVTVLRNNLIDQIGQATGGPLEYKGKTMAEAHKGMNISDVEFNALVAELGKAMTTKGVPTSEQAEVVAILGPLEPSIINK